MTSRSIAMLASKPSFSATGSPCRRSGEAKGEVTLSGKADSWREGILHSVPFIVKPYFAPPPALILAIPLLALQIRSLRAFLSEQVGFVFVRLDESRPITL